MERGGGGWGGGDSLGIDWDGCGHSESVLGERECVPCGNDFEGIL